jgi:hypothetical protein
MYLRQSTSPIPKLIPSNSPLKETEMNQLHSSRISHLLIPCIVLIALLSLSGCGAFITGGGQATPPLELDRVWTTVGSAGTLDETNASAVVLDHSTVQIGQVLGDTKPIGQVLGDTKPVALAAETTSAVIRYNVTPVDGLYDTRTPCKTGTGNVCPGVQLQLRYLASGLNAQVVARLVEVDLATGAETDRLKFDSSAFAEDNHYQVQQAGQCTPPALWRFDFEKKAYYVEATLTHNSLVISGAGIQMIKLAYITCLG